MHDLEMLVRLNSERHARKSRRANRRLNSPAGHPKSTEKGLSAALKRAGWTTDGEWEAKMRREGKRGLGGESVHTAGKPQKET